MTFNDAISRRDIKAAIAALKKMRLSEMKTALEESGFLYSGTTKKAVLASIQHQLLHCRTTGRLPKQPIDKAITAAFLTKHV